MFQLIFLRFLRGCAPSSAYSLTIGHEKTEFVKLNLEKHHRHRRDEVDEKTSLWEIHWLSLLITPSISIMQWNLSPYNPSLLSFCAVSHQCYMLLLQEFGVAFPHSLLNSSSLLDNLEKLTSLLAALKAAKLILRPSARAWGYFPFLSAFILLVIFSAALSPSLSPQVCFSFPATQIQSLQAPFWEGKRENKMIRISFHKFTKNKLTYQVHQAPKLHTSKTCFYLHTEQQCISQKNSEEGSFLQHQHFQLYTHSFLFYPCMKINT